MLPFLNRRKTVSTILAKRGNGPGTEVAPEIEAGGSEQPEGLRSAMEDFLDAVDRRSAVDMAKAFREGFQACEASPHEEFETEEGESDAIG